MTVRTRLTAIIRAYRFWRASTLLRRLNFHLQAADADGYAPSVLALEDAIRASSEDARREAYGLPPPPFKVPRVLF